VTFVDRFLQRWRIRRARRFLAPGLRVLDIGTADGALFRLCPRLRDGVGIDPVLPPKVRVAGAELVRGHFPRDLEDRRPFDVITLLAVVEHLERDKLAGLAAECASRLTPGGRVLITVPSPLVDSLLNGLVRLRLAHGMSLEDHHGFHPRQVPELFVPAGFSLERHERFQLGLNNLYVFRKV
jgi:2-polyprenyl-3-methyl-5-hydroxy-6-metoxy-1,4-benzoquinol methylase